MKSIIKLFAIFLIILSICFVTNQNGFVIDNRIVIAIDIGHGLDNPGAIGIVTEFDINELTGTKVVNLLEDDGRFKVVLTNKNRLIDSPLADRRDIAQNENADLLISIHANVSTSSYVNGFQVFPQVHENIKHEESYKFANIVKDGYLENSHTPRKSTGIFYARFEYVDETKTEYDRYIFTEEEEARYNFTGGTFGMLKSEAYPAVLIEQGYVTSPDDVENWFDDEGTSITAKVIYESILEYFEEELNNTSNNL